MLTRCGKLLCLVIAVLRFNAVVTDEPKAILTKVSQDGSVHVKKIVKGSPTILGKLNQKVVNPLDEKLGTSSTVPIGFATGNGDIAFDSPFTSGAYAGLGAHPASFVASPYQGEIVGGGLHHGHGQILTQQHGFGKHGQELGIGGLGHGGVGVGPTGGGYDGVMYGGYGNINKHPIVQDHVTINKQSGIGLGSFGEVHQGHAIQKAMHRVEAGGAVPFGMPYSPYGHGGVVYMGNGLISQHAAGVHLGPVIPPTGFQQQEHFAINKQSALGPFRNVHNGVSVKSAANSVGLGDPRYQQFSPKGFHPQGFGGDYSQRNFPYPQHQEFGISKQSEVGIDPYGNVQKGVNVQKEFSSGPGFGYNGFQNQGIGHTDQAIIGRTHHHTPYYNGRAFSNPDPYFNNQIDPIYRTDGLGHAMTLQTTGPNRYYQGKNPIGVYERFHRLG